MIHEQHAEIVRYTLDHIGECIFWLDAQGHIVAANHTTLRSLGYSWEELRQLSIPDIDPLWPPDRYLPPIQELIAHGTRKFESVHRSRDGREYPVEINSSMVSFNGEPLVCAFARDISEQKRVQQQLNESERQLNQLMAELPGMIYQSKQARGWHMQFVSAGCQALTGYTTEQLTDNRAMAYGDLILPEDRARVWAEGEAAVRARQPYSLEYRIRTANGAVRWVLEHGQGVLDGDGNLALEGFISDITALKQTQQALCASEQRFRAIFEQAAVGIAEVTLDGRLLRVNKKYCDIVGYNEQELSNLSLRQITHTDDLPRVQALLDETLSGRRDHYALEKRYLHKDQREVWAKTVVSLVRDRDGQPNRFIAIVEDITARKRAELALKESKERYHTLLISADDGVLLMDSAGYILECNPAAERLYGLPAGDLIGKRPHVELLPANLPNRDDYARLGQSLLQHAAQGLPQRFEWMHVQPGGARLETEVSLTRVDIGGTPQLFALFRDVSERKQNERRLCEQQAELEQVIGEREAYLAKLNSALRASIRAIATTVEKRDLYTAGHQGRVARLVTALATEMGIDPSTQEGLRFAATIHDLGKILVPAEILAKPTQLNDAEYLLIKMHPQNGYDILHEIDFPWPIAEVVRQHHERLDGSGYPQGLKGNAILLEARVLAVADVVEAMSSHRPYRPALGMDAALLEITSQRGTLYDPNVVDACVRLIERTNYQLN